MAEKTTPELPLVVSLPLGGTFTISRLARVDGEDRLHVTFVGAGTANGWLPVAELMRNLAAFVPEVEPIAWLDSDGSLWYFDEGTLRNTILPSPPLSRTIAEANEKHGPLTAIYAHPPVTAEPVTAPSVEQIAVALLPVMPNHTTDYRYDMAHKLRSLYGIPGGAGEARFNGKTLREMAHLAADLEERAGKAEARVERLQDEVDQANAERIDTANLMTEIEDAARAEVERYKAALEAAEEVVEAQSVLIARTADVRIAELEQDTAGTLLDIATDVYESARAAVEAETSEEAGDE